MGGLGLEGVCWTVRVGGGLWEGLGLRGPAGVLELEGACGSVGVGGGLREG